MSNLTRVLSRVCILGLFCYSWNGRLGLYENMPDELNPTVGYGSVWRFLTIQNFVLQIGINIFFLLGEVILLCKYIHVCMYVYVICKLR